MLDVLASLAGPALGLLAGGSSSSAGREAANAELEAARIGAQASAFRPVGITGRFAQSQFVTETDPTTGLPIVKEAGYTLTPDIAALQERLLGLTPGALERGISAYDRISQLEQAVPGLFGLSTQFLGASPQEIRQQYIEDQLAALEPGRIREEQRLGAGVFGRGRAGLNIGDIGQPDLYSLAAARRQQELDLAAGAEEAVRQRIGTGTGLLGTSVDLLNAIPAYEQAAMSPFYGLLTGAQSIEELGQQPLALGIEIGGQQSTAGARAGELLAAGGQKAAQTRLESRLAGQASKYGALEDILGLF